MLRDKLTNFIHTPLKSSRVSIQPFKNIARHQAVRDGDKCPAQVANDYNDLLSLPGDVVSEGQYRSKASRHSAPRSNDLIYADETRAAQNVIRTVSAQKPHGKVSRSCWSLLPAVKRPKCLQSRVKEISGIRIIIVVANQRCDIQSASRDQRVLHPEAKRSLIVTPILDLLPQCRCT